jgi:hypothetical protein
VWDASLVETKQQDLVITSHDHVAVTVDDLGVAQFVYLLTNSGTLRGVLETVTSKVILLLGRFSPERKIALDCLKDPLRARGYLPIIVDFNQPASRTLAETVRTLAHLSRFIIADLTDARSVPHELATIVQQLPSVPVQPLLLTGAEEYALFDSLRPYPWVLNIVRYSVPEDLLTRFEELLINPAETRLTEMGRPLKTLLR